MGTALGHLICIGPSRVVCRDIGVATRVLTQVRELAILGIRNAIKKEFFKRELIMASSKFMSYHLFKEPAASFMAIHLSAYILRSGRPVIAALRHSGTDMATGAVTGVL